MRLKINANPEIFQDCPVITGNVSIDVSQHDAYSVAAKVCNAISAGVFCNVELSADDIKRFEQDGINSAAGVQFMWEQ